MKSIDLICVSSKDSFTKRAKNVSEFFKFDIEVYKTSDEFFEGAENFKSITVVLLDCSSVEKPNEVAGMVQVATQMCGSSYIMVVMSSKLQPDDARIVKTSGASLVIMENEYFESSKVEFVTSQIIRASHIPIKTLDLIPGTETDFSLFYLMPANRKYLKVATPGSKIRPDFIEKYNEVGELYIPRSDLPKWIEYCRSFDAEDGNSALRKCRLKFLQLNQSFLELSLMITDQSAASSFALGKELFNNCEAFGKELLKSFSQIDDPWLVISGSSMGDFGSVERAPSIAAYAGFLSQKLGQNNASEVMVGALLADIGYLTLSPQTAQKIREGRLEDLNPEQKVEYEKHPIFSLNQCLSRKLPFTDSIKNMILQSHERPDAKGFPNKISSERLTFEAMLIRLCWELDSRMQVRMGEKKKTIEEVRKDIHDTVLLRGGNYTITFMTAMQPLLV